jgi:hypothetical protein
MKRFAVLLLVSLAAGCSGAGSSGTPAPATTVPPTAAPAASPTATPKPALAAGSASVFIPNASTAAARTRARRRDWVSPSTQSIGITATAADGYAGNVITAVSAGASNCTTVAGGRTCTLGFDAPPGDDTIQILAFDQPNEYLGNVLATATVNGVNIVAAGNNSLNFTLGGVVGQAPNLSPASFTVAEGNASDLTLTIAGYDVDGNPISLYDSPLVITQTDTTGTYTLSNLSIVDSSVTPSITIHYNGGQAPTTITVATSSTVTTNNFGAQQASVTITPYAP